MDIAVNGLSIDVLEAQLREFEPETIMAERADESTLVFELAKKNHLNFALIHPNIYQLDDQFLILDWARVFLLDQDDPNLDVFNTIGAIEFEYDQYLEQARNLMNNCAFYLDD